eukprot:GDKJ01031562.1.p1 GENE.GDKJ01031562.1~~GDKJ01031562.1.p1  ORF type:complete len:2129 (-),score=624.36 GDKJ01031562.1:688-6480(-)
MDIFGLQVPQYRIPTDAVAVFLPKKLTFPWTTARDHRLVRTSWTHGDLTIAIDKYDLSGTTTFSVRLLSIQKNVDFAAPPESELMKAVKTQQDIPGFDVDDVYGILMNLAEKHSTIVAQSLYNSAYDLRDFVDFSETVKAYLDVATTQNAENAEKTTAIATSYQSMSRIYPFFDETDKKAWDSASPCHNLNLLGTFNSFFVADKDNTGVEVPRLVNGKYEFFRPAYASRSIISFPNHILKYTSNPEDKTFNEECGIYDGKEWTSHVTTYKATPSEQSVTRDFRQKLALRIFSDHNSLIGFVISRKSLSELLKKEWSVYASAFDEKWIMLDNLPNSLIISHGAATGIFISSSHPNAIRMWVAKDALTRKWTANVTVIRGSLSGVKNTPEANIFSRALDDAATVNLSVVNSIQSALEYAKKSDHSTTFETFEKFEEFQKNIAKSVKREDMTEAVAKVLHPININFASLYENIESQFAVWSSLINSKAGTPAKGEGIRNPVDIIDELRRNFRKSEEDKMQIMSSALSTNLNDLELIIKKLLEEGSVIKTKLSEACERGHTIPSTLAASIDRLLQFDADNILYTHIAQSLKARYDLVLKACLENQDASLSAADFFLDDAVVTTITYFQEYLKVVAEKIPNPRDSALTPEILDIVKNTFSLVNRLSKVFKTVFKNDWASVSGPVESLQESIRYILTAFRSHFIASPKEIGLKNMFKTLTNSDLQDKVTEDFQQELLTLVGYTCELSVPSFLEVFSEFKSFHDRIEAECQVPKDAFLNSVDSHKFPKTNLGFLKFCLADDRIIDEMNQSQKLKNIQKFFPSRAEMSKMISKVHSTMQTYMVALSPAVPSSCLDQVVEKFLKYEESCSTSIDDKNAMLDQHVACPDPFYSHKIVKEDERKKFIFEKVALASGALSELSSIIESYSYTFLSDLQYSIEVTVNFDELLKKTAALSTQLKNTWIDLVNNNFIQSLNNLESKRKMLHEVNCKDFNACKENIEKNVNSYSLSIPNLQQFLNLISPFEKDFTTAINGVKPREKASELRFTFLTIPEKGDERKILEELMGYSSYKCNIVEVDEKYMQSFRDTSAKERVSALLSAHLAGRVDAARRLNIILGELVKLYRKTVENETEHCFLKADDYRNALETLDAIAKEVHDTGVITKELPDVRIFETFSRHCRDEQGRSGSTNKAVFTKHFKEGAIKKLFGDLSDSISVNNIIDQFILHVNQKLETFLTQFHDDQASSASTAYTKFMSENFNNLFSQLSKTKPQSTATGSEMKKKMVDDMANRVLHLVNDFVKLPTALNIPKVSDEFMFKPLENLQALGKNLNERKTELIASMDQIKNNLQQVKNKLSFAIKPFSLDENELVFEPVVVTHPDDDDQHAVAPAVQNPIVKFTTFDRLSTLEYNINNILAEVESHAAPIALGIEKLSSLYKKLENRANDVTYYDTTADVILQLSGYLSDRNAHGDANMIKFYTDKLQLIRAEKQKLIKRAPKSDESKKKENEEKEKERQEAERREREKEEQKNHPDDENTPDQPDEDDEDFDHGDFGRRRRLADGEELNNIEQIIKEMLAQHPKDVQTVEKYMSASQIAFNSLYKSARSTVNIDHGELVTLVDSAIAESVSEFSAQDADTLAMIEKIIREALLLKDSVKTLFFKIFVVEGERYMAEQKKKNELEAEKNRIKQRNLLNSEFQWWTYAICGYLASFGLLCLFAILYFAVLSCLRGNSQVKVSNDQSALNQPSDVRAVETGAITSQGAKGAAKAKMNIKDFDDIADEFSAPLLGNKNRGTPSNNPTTVVSSPASSIPTSPTVLPTLPKKTETTTPAAPSPAKKFEAPAKNTPASQVPPPAVTVQELPPMQPVAEEAVAAPAVVVPVIAPVPVAEVAAPAVVESKTAAPKREEEVEEEDFKPVTKKNASSKKAQFKPKAKKNYAPEDLDF